MDLVKAFDTVPRDVLFVVLAKFGVPPHLISVIKRMNTDLQVTFDLNGEPVAVPCLEMIQLLNLSSRNTRPVCHRAP